jgi:hypothetical protein
MSAMYWSIKIILSLNHNYHGNPMRWSCLQTQICSNGVNNDDIKQHLNIIHQKPQRWFINAKNKGRQQKNMNLFT